MTFPLEYAFQKEFYRSFYTVVDGSVMISPEYVVKRGKCGGTIDFLVSSKGLGFELLRNRDKIVEHMNRFEVGGAYYHLIDTRVMQKYIVLDFTCMMPHKQRPGNYPSHLPLSLSYLQAFDMSNMYV